MPHNLRPTIRCHERHRMEQVGRSAATPRRRRKWWRAWLGLGWIGLSVVATAPALAAHDLSQLYARAVLEAEREAYQRQSARIVDELIWDLALDPEDRLRLGGRKPILDLPTYAEGAARGHPLAFYAPGEGRIVLPLFSLKFLDDLSVAYAWLQVNDFSLETVSDYTSILRYHADVPVGGFPPPLDALQVPGDARAEPRVAELADGHFVSALTFIILHELGHLRHGHRTISVPNEREADRFAARAMADLALPPLGMVPFFLADAAWSDADGSSHPASGERLAALAASVGDPVLAEDLLELAPAFDDPDIRESFMIVGRAGDIAALAPRRVGELLPRQPDASAASNRAFTGAYRGEFVQFPVPEPLAIEFTFERQGDDVVGSFGFGLGNGTVEGRVEGAELHLAWAWAGNSGRGVLVARRDGSLAGTWGLGEAQAGAGLWSAEPIAPAGDEQGQGDARPGAPPLEGEDRLRGRRFRVSYREGGPVFGTYFWQDVHLCATGGYWLSGESRKQTVLGNEQIDVWEEAGRWRVAESHGGSVLELDSGAGRVVAVPFRWLPGDELWLGDAVAVQGHGPAQCE